MFNIKIFSKFSKLTIWKFLENNTNKINLLLINFINIIIIVNKNIKKVIQIIYL